MSDPELTISVKQALEVANKDLIEGRLTAAEQIYRRIINIQPRNADALHKLGVIAHRNGNTELAENLFLQSVSINPSSSQVYFDLGGALQDLRKFGEAITNYQKALTLKKDYPDAHNNMGVAYRELGQVEKATECYKTAIAAHPNYAAAHSNLGLLMQESGNLEIAIDSFQKALQISPDSAPIHYNLGVTLQALVKLPDAIESYRNSILLNPNLAQAHVNLGLALRDMLKFDEAIASYERALAIDPAIPEARYNLGLLQLLLGDYDSGWDNYKWRWETRPRDCHPNAEKKPLWDGNSLASKTIYLYAEQGFGDTIQFIRYVRLLKRYDCKVIVQSQQPLKRLFQHSSIADEIISPGETPSAFDCHSSLLDLPRLMKTTLGTIPDGTSYLHPSLDLRKKWRNRFGEKEKLRVGIVWAGNPDQINDRYRSVDPSLFTPLTQIRLASFYSLQVGNATNSSCVLGENVKDLSPLLTDFAETAAAMSHLDLIISVDTSAAHLAGSLGMPVWVPLHVVSHWIYRGHGDHCPWYPTMRLFRQEQRGDWESVFVQLKESFLNQLVSVANPIERE